MSRGATKGTRGVIVVARINPDMLGLTAGTGGPIVRIRARKYRSLFRTIGSVPTYLIGKLQSQFAVPALSILASRHVDWLASPCSLPLALLSILLLPTTTWEIVAAGEGRPRVRTRPRDPPPRGV